ncbi:MAG TPA: UbiD family decarboxylase, partial [Dehalococcoidia bacterium]|nr:UbiD family decarboxylase [Dehalococcoidia bacterium]
PMPICIAIGGDPAITLAGCMPVPRGQNESVVAGALRQEPLQLVRAETNELLVPADAEIVIEGELRPNERMDEGPFGEYIGFMHGPRVPRPVLRVTCITYRNNPVIPFLVEGDPAAGSCISAWYLMSIAHTLRLRGMGINYCVDAWTGEWPNTLGTANHFKLLPTNAMPEALPSQFLTWAGYGYASMAVLFDPDLKPFDAEDLIEHFFVKTHPTNFRSTDPDLAKHPLNVFQTPEEKARGIAAGMTVNTQWPAHWYPDRIPQRPTFENSYPAEVQGWVADNWEKLGLSPRDRRSSRPETSRG